MRYLARRCFTLCSAVSSLILCAAACGSTGCIPLKQRNVTGGQGYDHFGYDGGYGWLMIGPSNVPQSVTVVDAESYAIAPNGKRYGIETEPERRRSPDDPPNEGDRVYLVRANGRRTTRDWANGRWELFFTLDTPHGRDTRHFTVDFWTFNYQPLIHGPPN